MPWVIVAADSRVRVVYPFVICSHQPTAVDDVMSKARAYRCGSMTSKENYVLWYAPHQRIGTVCFHSAHTLGVYDLEFLVMVRVFVSRPRQPLVNLKL